MRPGWTNIGAILFAATLAGCVPEITGTSGSVIDAVLGVDDDATQPQDKGTTIERPEHMLLTGAVSRNGDYVLFDLGAASTGQQWTVAAGALTVGNAFLVVLFDSDQDLLYRKIISVGYPLEHIVRGPTEHLYAGVTSPYISRGGDFRLEVTRGSAGTVPAPRQQVVWVNFEAASGVQVHRRSDISFPAFDAGRLNADYAGATETVRDAVLDAMREDYAGYDVVILSSFDGRPPEDPHSVVHIGGDDDRLLGLADNVDQYNTDPDQTAIIFVEAFADFRTMQLTAEEMGQMIGNVASHELGHLLGLYHTKSVVDIMDTTGSAWDLAADQSFTRGELEPSVFPTGYENCPVRLAEIVGQLPDGKPQDTAKRRLTEKMVRKAELRAMIRETLRCRCGNCLDPDE